MPYRFQPWLLALVLLAAVALLALIANAQQAMLPRVPTDRELQQELAFEAIEGVTGEFMVIRWEDGREVHVRTRAINVVRYYPPGHEGGDARFAVIEMVAAGAMQRIEVDKDLADKLLKWGTRKRVVAWDSDGKEIKTSQKEN